MARQKEKQKTRMKKTNMKKTKMKKTKMKRMMKKRKRLALLIFKYPSHFSNGPAIRPNPAQLASKLEARSSKLEARSPKVDGRRRKTHAPPPSIFQFPIPIANLRLSHPRLHQPPPPPRLSCPQVRAPSPSPRGEVDIENLRLATLVRRDGVLRKLQSASLEIALASIPREIARFLRTVESTIASVSQPPVHASRAPEEQEPCRGDTTEREPVKLTKLDGIATHIDALIRRRDGGSGKDSGSEDGVDEHHTDR
ncbi:hypothetical protein MBM_05379 [Drepanopeziza brunnea f. sp. 'multigermtubi' MB_m1]|uniref:Uncharacterized protein n=1 Tax=Marssonina brunnea f. sp. multigermtubi (strain MB_m1) TaxID=1072389 RepID=K1WH43_MARBU|nr:uncharacterized protein MBM_05379 [Drepanopeziza brunnea f. sp. 'multigermtubi' MB_m1]EKD16910.1 hypothetical protein MBM_05379 [Drepanopeziza brunnea f. sp. 'multigermtubi' MB_m1]